MPIIFQHRIYREDLRNNPQTIYIFGDNLERVGMGGQAAHMRNEPNAIGVATKRCPNDRETSFFADREEEMKYVNDDLIEVWKLHLAGRTIVVPSDGIGTGLSELPQRSPKIHAEIKRVFGMMADRPLPWV